MLGSSNDGVIFLSFTKEMLFPSDLQKTLNLDYVQSNLNDVDPISSTRLLSDEQEPKSQNMLTVQMLLTQTSEIVEIPWKVTSVIPNLITINVDFVKPLHVSQGDKPDEILVSMSFTNITDVDGFGLAAYHFNT